MEELYNIINSVPHEPGCFCKKCIQLRLIREREACEECTDMNGTSILQEKDV